MLRLTNPLGLMLFLLSAAAWADDPPQQSPQSEPAIDPSQAVGFPYRLTAAALGGDTNVVVSPTCLLPIFQVLYRGAANETAAELERAWGKTQLEQPLLVPPTTESRGKPVELTIATSLWLEQNAKLKAEFLDANRNHPGLEFHAFQSSAIAQARQAINDWCSEKTKKKIPEILRDGDLAEDARLVIAAAVYFKAAWQTPFDPAQTHPETFYVGPKATVDVPFMHQSIYTRYTKTEGWQAVELPYSDRVHTLLLLQSTHHEKAFSGASLLQSPGLAAEVATLIKDAKPTFVNIGLPKFTIKSATDMTAVLPELGIKTLTTREADLSRMSEEDLMVSKFRLQSVIAVDEAGTEAATAAAAVVSPKFAVQNPKPVLIRFDRPFIAILRNAKSGATHFIAYVGKPEA